MEIRDVGEADVPELTRLIELLGYPTLAESVAERVRRFAVSDADRLFVADVDGQLAGFAALHVSLSVEYDQPAAKLNALVVDDRFRRRGVGRALVEALEQEARTRGCCLVFVTTAERRSDAQAFYQAVGYDYTGRRYAKSLTP